MHYVQLKCGNWTIDSRKKGSSKENPIKGLLPKLPLAYEKTKESTTSVISNFMQPDENITDYTHIFHSFISEKIATNEAV